MQRPDRTVVIVDAADEVFEDFDDFHAHSASMADANSIILTRTPGWRPPEDVELVTLKGRGGPPWGWWVLGSAGAVALPAAARMRRRRRAG